MTQACSTAPETCMGLSWVTKYSSHEPAEATTQNEYPSYTYIIAP